MRSPCGSLHYEHGLPAGQHQMPSSHPLGQIAERIVTWIGLPEHIQH